METTHLQIQSLLSGDDHAVTSHPDMDSIFFSADRSQVAAITPLGRLSECNTSTMLLKY